MPPKWFFVIKKKKTPSINIKNKNPYLELAIPFPIYDITNLSD